MHIKNFLFPLFFFFDISLAHSKATFIPSQLSPAFQKLLLELSSNFFTVVKENQVDLDSSLIYVSTKLKLSRLQIAAEGINDDNLIKQSTWFDQRNIKLAENQLNTKKGKIYAEQLILIGAYYAFEPGNNIQANILGIQNLNKAINVCLLLNEKELISVAQRLMGKIFLKENNLSSADSIFKIAIKYYDNESDKYNQAKTLQWWALYTPVTPTSTAGRLNNIKLAIKLFESMNNQEEAINALVNNSYLYLLNYNLDSAYVTALKADILCKQLKFPYEHYVGAALNTLTMFQGKFGEPLQYALEASKNAELLNDSIGLPYFYGEVGVMYVSEEFQPETAIQWNLKSINTFLAQNEPCYLVLSNVVSDLVTLNRSSEALTLIEKVYKKTPPKLPSDYLFYYLALDDYYVQKGNTKAALDVLKKAKGIESTLESQGMNIRKAAILFAFGKLYFSQNEYAKALPYFTEFIQQKSNVAGTVYAKSRAWLMLISIDSALGNKDQQLFDYRNYTSTMDEYYAISKGKLAEELRIKYGTEAKENQIKLLIQKSQLEKDKAKQADLIKNVSIAGIVLILIIAILLYRQNVIRQRNGKIISNKNLLLQRLVEEKEWLIKEVHHRVKNNLHTVICLLESQAAYLDNDALNAVEKSQHRIYAMSLIHQKLYQSDDLKVIDMKVYLVEFVQYLIESFGSPENIEVVVNVDAIKLSASQAIPLGLIVNEAVSNSFKYAFPNNRSGKVSIRLKREENQLFLTIADDGIGSAKKPGENLNSLGLELIEGLAKDLRANLIFQVNEGTIIKIDFLMEQLSYEVETPKAIS